MDDDRLDEMLAQFDKQTSLLRQLSPRLERLVTDLVSSTGIDLHSIRARPKKRESLSKKLSGADPPYRKLEEVTDLLGVRIITFFPDHVDLVARTIEREFKIDSDNSIDKRAAIDPDRFGYISLHYVATLSDGRMKLPEYSVFEGITFEIQIRSILQHAWAEIEHDLGYKSELEVPYEIRRRFSRLAGVLELADDEFASVREALDEYGSTVKQSIETSPETVSINRDSIAELIRSDLVRKVDKRLAKAMGNRVVGSSDRAGSEAANLQAAGFSTINEVKATLTDRQDDVVRFAGKWNPGYRKGGVSHGISLFFLAYLVVGERGYEAAREYVDTRRIVPRKPDAPDVAQRVVDTVHEVMKMGPSR